LPGSQQKALPTRTQEARDTGSKIMVEQKIINRKGRPRVNIAPETVLNAWGQYRSIRAVAKSLNITSGTAWRRLKEIGVTPLGLSRSEAGQLGAKVRQLNRECGQRVVV